MGWYASALLIGVGEFPIFTFFSWFKPFLWGWGRVRGSASRFFLLYFPSSVSYSETGGGDESKEKEKKKHCIETGGKRGSERRAESESVGLSVSGSGICPTEAPSTRCQIGSASKGDRGRLRDLG